MKLNIVPTNELDHKFTVHLNDESNSNIFFSGRYGTGKSTFLHKYFQNNSDKFTAITLRPIHYSVTSNEDVFELIKVDIIKQLYINGHLNLEKDKANNLLSVTTDFIKSNPIKFVWRVAEILSKLSPLAEVAAKTSKSVYDLLGDLKKLENELSPDDGDTKLLQHLDEFRLKTGTYFEYDLITELIYNCISRLQDNSNVVLIIDDLDRLDPEHIFRILNILSSHQGEDIAEHKFGFKKVILVGDLENIKSLFHHKYGISSDFDGYIDKFYSKEIFEFSNNENLHNFIFNDLEINLGENEKYALCYLLAYFVKKKRLKLRNIVKHRNFKSFACFKLLGIKFTELQGEITASKIPHIDLSEDGYIESDSLPELRLIQYLIEIFGNLTSLQLALKELSEDKTEIPPSEQERLFKAFVRLEKLLEAKYNPFLCAFRKVNHDMIDGYSIDSNYPIVNIGNQSYGLTLRWNAGKKYMGNFCLYNGIVVTHKRLNRDIQALHSNLGNLLEKYVAYVNRNWNKEMNIYSATTELK